MYIYAENGTKIRYTGNGGWDYQRESANKILTIGQDYTVDYTVVHGWYTDVYLIEIPDISFNSCLFEDIE